MIGQDPAPPSPATLDATDRRRQERRGEALLADLSLPELRRLLVTTAVGTIVAALFLWMVRAVLVAGILGAVSAAFLRPIYDAVLRRVRSGTAAGILTIILVFVPIVATLAYGYGEAVGVASYVGEHQAQVTARVSAALARTGIARGGVTAEEARRWVFAAGAYGAALPGAARAAIAHGAVAATVFVFTLMYMLTDSAHVLAYVRGRISPRQRALTDALERNVRGAVAGVVYGSVLAQLLKSIVVFALAIAFRVPLAAALAIVSFVLGFFPIVGSWSVYLPMAAWLFVFRDETWSAVMVVAAGFAVNTVFISTYLRPKLAARRSHVLNFYWMFVGLATGAYAFGLPGLVLGPALIALLKAVVDTVTDPARGSTPLDAPTSFDT